MASVALFAAMNQDLPVIKVTTRLVQVDVVVRDAKGPVSGLTQDDFRVFDQGKPQKIALFQVNGKPTSTSATPSAPAAEAGVFTNREVPASGPATVILLDGLLTNLSNQMRTRPQLLKFLAQVKPTDRVAIYLLNGGVQTVQPFTGDSAMLVHAMEVQQWGYGNRANPMKPAAAFRNARTLANAKLAALVKGVNATFIQNNTAPLASQVRQACIGLMAVARDLASVPGRKNLFWYTDGFPLVSWSAETQTYMDEVSQANHTFSDANVSVYPIDTHGLVAPDIAPASVAAPAAATGAVASGLPKGIASIGLPNQDMMNNVAKFTGGQAFVDANDMSAPLEKVKQDTASTYTLCFYPDTASLDSKRHTLKVEVAQKGISLQYRQDYNATPEPPETKIPGKVEIAEAIWSPVNATDIAINVRVEKVNEPQPGMLRLTLGMAPDDLTFEQGEQVWTGTLAMTYDERSATGEDLGRISETLNLRYDAEHYRKLSADSVTYQKLVRPGARAAQIRIVVYDRGSGRVGSVTVKL